MKIHWGGAKRGAKNGLISSIFVHKKYTSNKEQKIKIFVDKTFCQAKVTKIWLGEEIFS